jgi:hypothetical protein
LNGQEILPLFIENPCNACFIPTKEPKRYFYVRDENQDWEAYSVREPFRTSVVV